MAGEGFDQANPPASSHTTGAYGMRWVPGPVDGRERLITVGSKGQPPSSASVSTGREELAVQSPRRYANGVRRSNGDVKDNTPRVPGTWGRGAASVLNTVSRIFPEDMAIETRDGLFHESVTLGVRQDRMRGCSDPAACASPFRQSDVTRASGRCGGWPDGGGGADQSTGRD
jgi:hypothetical protein